MELFRNLPWKISEPSMLDVGTNFLKEETVAQSYLFLNNFTPEKLEEEKPKLAPKNSGLTDKQKKTFKQYQKQSRLNAVQHKKCLQALMLLNSDRPLSSFCPQEQQTINLYNNLKTVILEENAEFLKFVEDEWNKKLHNRVGVMPKILMGYGMRHRSKKFERIKEYPEFYTMHFNVPLSRNEHPVDIEHGPCLLQLGSVAQLNIPDIEIKDSVAMNRLPPLTENVSDICLEPTKQCVSKDMYAEFLANKSLSNVVISTSSLKAIIDNFGPDFSTSWDIPIVVKEHEENGIKFKVVYIDKPLPQRHITIADIDYDVRKGLLKHILCTKNSFSFPTPQFITEYFQTNTTTTNSSNNEPNIKLNEYECIPAKKQKLSPEPSDNIIIGDENMEYKSETNDTLDKQMPILDSPVSPDQTIDDLINNQMENKSETTNCLKKKQNLISDSPASPDQTIDSLINKQKNQFGTTDSFEQKQNLILDSPASPDQTVDDLINKEIENKSETTDSLGKKQNLIPDSPASPDQTIDDLINKQMESKLSDAEEGEITGEDEEISNKREKNRTGKKCKKTPKITNKNVAYKLWNLKVKEEENLLMKNCAEKKNIKIIIRTKCDGYTFQPNGPILFTNIVPKLEYQREHGGQVLTKSELLRQWTTLHFNPYPNSNLLRVRIFPNGNKYLKIETLNLNKVTNECLKKQNFNPKETLGTLYNVLSQLTNLKEEGNYVLHHTPKHGPFAALYKTSKDDACNKFNLHELYKEEICSVSHTNRWLPIDTTLVLPYHEKSDIMPGLFPPNRQFTKRVSQGKGQQKGKKNVMSKK